MTNLAALVLAISAMPAFAGLRSSASYSVTDVHNGAGGSALSADYYCDSSAAASVAYYATYSTDYLVKNGFAGQLFDVIGFVLDANSTGVGEGGSLQLFAAHLLDDATRQRFQSADVIWSIVDGPLASITQDGLVTADVVYTHTNASVAGSYGSSSSNLLITVLNTQADNLPGYANDGIDDDWQVQYFGLPPNPLAGPDVDADGTGQSNFFKFVAGLNPLDGSRFTLSNTPVPGEPSQMSVTFGPTIPDRSYVVESTHSLAAPDWMLLPNASESDHGNYRTVTDYDALPAPKFYRVRISRP